MMNNLNDIVKCLKSEEEYMKEIEKLHQELGFILFTNTAITGETEKLTRRMCEKIAIVEFIRSVKK